MYFKQLNETRFMSKCARNSYMNILVSYPHKENADDFLIHIIMLILLRTLEHQYHNIFIDIIKRQFIIHKKYGSQTHSLQSKDKKKLNTQIT